MTTPTPEGPNQGQQFAAGPAVPLKKTRLSELASATVDLGNGVTYIGITTLATSRDPQTTYDWLQRIISPDWFRGLFPELQGVAVSVSAVPNLRGWTVEVGATPATPEQAQALGTRLMAAEVDVPVGLTSGPTSEPPESGKEGASPWLWAAVGVLTLAVMGGLIFLLSGSRTTPAPEPTATTVSAPSVVGFTVPDATQALQSVGLVIGDIQERPSDQPKGVVLEQTPRSGEVVTKNTRVNLVIAGDPEPVIPDVVGLSQSEATNALLDAGFRVGMIETEDSAKPAGTVVKQNPVAGNTAPKDTEISIVLSTGIISVPPVVGFSEAEATALLQDAGFQVRTQTQESTQVGVVLSQSPEAGAKLEVGKTVVITVGIKVAPTPSPTPSPSGSDNP
jgi:beta-lactam-binding protein with PASTA domain